MKLRTVGRINIFYNNGEHEEINYKPQNGFYNEMLNIYNALNHNEPVQVTPEVCYGDTKMALDILKSIEDDYIVAVDTDIKQEEKAFAPR